ncbi:MAG: 7-cyano-7-deazaguanine synthase [Gammaproteobacteria bacterium]|nr:7-cyano-7-deazaguanine synthase [Gammaproteobacteria bacterium]MDE2716450.1 7-cyano-7-deazaguanine synthase [Chloroflexota bacterium]
MQIVTLSSGGVDSTLMSVLARDQGHVLFPLFVDYGQLSAKREWDACQRLHAKLDLPAARHMELAGFGQVIPSGLTDSRLRINEDAFLPGRNLLLLLAGAAYAYSVAANYVALGLLSPAQRLFPDQTRGFVDDCERTIEAAMGVRITVLTPLLDLTKADVLALAQAQGIRETYSCHSGLSRPCGRCISCEEIEYAKRRM